MQISLEMASCESNLSASSEVIATNTKTDSETGQTDGCLALWNHANTLLYIFINILCEICKGSIG